MRIPVLYLTDAAHELVMFRGAELSSPNVRFVLHGQRQSSCPYWRRGLRSPAVAEEVPEGEADDAEGSGDHLTRSWVLWYE